MKTRTLLVPICVLLVLLWVGGCASGEEGLEVAETTVSATSTPIPATETAVPPTNTPIPPTATPEPSPTPINLVAVVDEFVQTLNDGGDVIDYLTEEASIEVVGDAPIYVETLADFVAFSQGVGSEFLLEGCEVVETAVTCTAKETNDWLPILFEDDPETSLVYDKFDFVMNGDGRVASLTLQMAEETVAFWDNFLVGFDEWLFVNELHDADALFTEARQLIYNQQSGENLSGWVSDFYETMTQIFELIPASEQAYQTGDYETAVALYTEILDLKPPLSLQFNILVNRADVYDSLGDYEAAIVDYETAVAIRDDDPDVLNNLCWDLAITEQPERALPYCDKSIALEPDPASMDSRGVALGQLGEFEAAIADFEAVVADLADSSNPELVAIRGQRTEWIAQMQQGQNPFTPALLAELRNEEMAVETLPNVENIQTAVNTVLFDEEIRPLPIDAITYFESSDGSEISYPMRVLMDDQGLIWFAGYDGIASYQSSSGWQTYDLSTGDLGLVTLTQNQQKEMLASGCAGIYRLVAQEWQALPLSEALPWCATKMAVGSDGTVWINQLDIPQARGHGVLSLATGETDAVWFGNTGDVEAHPERAMQTPWEDGYVTAIIPRENGEIWFGTTEGLYTFLDGVWGRFDDEIYGGNSWITTAGVGPDGVVWIGTPIGFARFDGQEWTSYQSSSQTAHDVFSFGFDGDGMLWISTLMGIARFENDTLILYEYGENGPFAQISRPQLIGMSIEGIVDSMVIDALGDIWMPAGPVGIMQVDIPEQ